MVTGNTREIFDSPSVPERIYSVLISTEDGPRTINFTPPNRINLFLDFRRPRLLNSGVMPSAPTPNESNYAFSANNEGWATSLSAQLRKFF